MRSRRNISVYTKKCWGNSGPPAPTGSKRGGIHALATSVPLAKSPGPEIWGNARNTGNAAWGRALGLAEDSLQRKGGIHLARFKMNAGLYAEARAHLNAVTNAELRDWKGRVQRNLREKASPPVPAVTKTPLLEPPNSASPSP